MVILRADRRLCAATVGLVTPLQWIRDQELRGADNPAVDHTCIYSVKVTGYARIQNDTGIQLVLYSVLMFIPRCQVQSIYPVLCTGVMDRKYATIQVSYL